MTKLLISNYIPREHSESNNCGTIERTIQSRLISKNYERLIKHMNIL